MEHEFSEIFELEMECWCHGLSRLREQATPEVIYQVVREFSPVLREAITHGYVCDIADVTHQLITAARYKGSEKEITFYILALLPFPAELNDVERGILRQTVELVEHKYSGAAERLQKKWKAGHHEGTHFSGHLALPGKTATASR